MKKKLTLVTLTLLILLLFQSFVFVQTRNIDERLKGLDSFIEDGMKDWNVPGLAIGIVEGEQIIYLKGYGLRDVERKLPVTENTLFGIGSHGKTITA